MASTKTEGFSVSKQYKKIISDIFNEIPSSSKSRFICQAIVEKAQRTQNLQMFDLVGQNIVFSNNQNNLDFYKNSKNNEDNKEIKQEMTIFEKTIKVLTDEEIKEHEVSLNTFKNNKEVLESIVKGLIEERVNESKVIDKDIEKESTKEAIEESREELKSIVNNW